MRLGEKEVEVRRTTYLRDAKRVTEKEMGGWLLEVVVEVVWENAPEKVQREPNGSRGMQGLTAGPSRNKGRKDEAAKRGGER
jgi:hypothetical protein